MPHPTLTRASVSRFLHTAVGAVALLQLSLATPALAQQVTMETLLDRIQIEDLLVKYYYDLASGRAHEMSEYFTEDAMLDVDGTIANGRADIEKLYGGGARARDPNAAPRPHNGMLLTNPVIEVKGNRAQAHVIWTGVSNKGVGQPPSLYEEPHFCSFAPRCPYAFDRCRAENPPLIERSPGRRVACFWDVERNTEYDPGRRPTMEVIDGDG